MQILVTNDFTPYSWSFPGKSELDFVFQDRQGNIISLEVKAAENVKAKSLKLFMSLYKPAYGIRVSAKKLVLKITSKAYRFMVFFVWLRSQLFWRESLAESMTDGF